ncbi:hypothetical protein BaRGS_00011065 [Batillaria attramentaria]|uniref:Uncharacterized protein n=1 Tax=Batillaria attramentaria TaxID=370345 RepID=A0ABD0LE59_9CAEN
MYSKGGGNGGEMLTFCQSAMLCFHCNKSAAFLVHCGRFPVAHTAHFMHIFAKHPLETNDATKTGEQIGKIGLYGFELFSPSTRKCTERWWGEGVYGGAARGTYAPHYTQGWDPFSTACISSVVRGFYLRVHICWRGPR